MLKSVGSGGSHPDSDHNTRKGLVAEESGFSLHAGVATKAGERDKLEKICRYIARPAIAEERLSINEQGDVVYTLKKPWDDGTTAVKMTQMQLMERLTALIPRPRAHLTRYHGVLAPHYKYRKLIVPAKKEDPLPEPPTPTVLKDQAAHAKRISWARLLARVFKIDVTSCPKCNGKVRIIAAIEDPKVIKKILDHMGLPSAPPKLKPARGPPAYSPDEDFVQSFFED